MKPHRHSLKNGFSLLELVVALGLFSFVSFAAFQFFQSFSKQQSVGLQNITQDLEAIVLERAVRLAIVNMHPSYNLINVPDDNGNNFFDYLPDELCQSDCERQLTLSADSPIQFFPLLQTLHDVAAPRLYTPQFAYNIGTNNSLNTAGSLNFASINKTVSATGRGYLEALFKKDGAPNENYLSAGPDDPLHFKLLLFSSLVELRDVSSSTPFPRKSAYLGRFDSQSFNISATNPNNLFNLSHPLNSSVVFNDVPNGSFGSPSYGVNGIDRFLRTVPPVGGVNAMAKVSVVGLKRFFFQAAANGQESQILQQDWNVKENRWEVPGFPIGIGVKSLTLKRRNVSSPVIEIDIVED